MYQYTEYKHVAMPNNSYTGVSTIYGKTFEKEYFHI